MNKISDIEAFYGRTATEYSARTIGCDMSAHLSQFVQYLPAGGHVVDAGCGSGRDSAWFIAQGYQCYSYDASPEMCQVAQAYLGEAMSVYCHRHDALKPNTLADGIWASASLLFLNDGDLKAALETFHAAMKPGAVLYALFKHGAGWRQDGERWFRDLRPHDASLLESLSGLQLEKVVSNIDTLGRGNQWNAFVLRKAS